MIWFLIACFGIIALWWGLRWFARSEPHIVAARLKSLFHFLLLLIIALFSLGRYFIGNLFFLLLRAGFLRGLFSKNQRPHQKTRRRRTTHRSSRRSSRRDSSYRDSSYRGRGRASTQSGRMTAHQARQILKLESYASVDDIRKAWRQQIKSAHPDLGGKLEDAIKINEARDVLLGKK